MPRTTKLKKKQSELNERFPELCDANFKAKFSREIKTRFQLWSMELVSEPVEGRKLTKEQYDWLAGFSDGYAAAMSEVTK